MEPFLDDFSYCEALENAAAPIKHFVTVRNGASGAEALAVVQA